MVLLATTTPAPRQTVPLQQTPGTLPGVSTAVVLTAVAQGLVEAEQPNAAMVLLDEAVTTARSIEHASDRAWALKEVVQAVAKAGKFAEAAAIARTIEEGSLGTNALTEVVQAAAKAGKFAEAEALARTIEDAQERAEALKEVVQAITEAGKFAEAVTIARSIEVAGQRAKALTAVTQILVENRDDALRLIQLSWRAADTRDYLLQLLPLANALIQNNPELGIALVEGMAWVDAFLKT